MLKAKRAVLVLGKTTLCSSRQLLARNPTPCCRRELPSSWHPLSRLHLSSLSSLMCTLLQELMPLLQSCGLLRRWDVDGRS